MNICEKCSKEFYCGSSTSDLSCWCNFVSLNKEISKKFKDCLCPTCLGKYSTKPHLEGAEGTKKINENEDYYYNEKGLLVFTKEYHLKRGYCCGNNCKHCPYKTADSSFN